MKEGELDWGYIYPVYHGNSHKLRCIERRPNASLCRTKDEKTSPRKASHYIHLAHLGLLPHLALDPTNWIPHRPALRPDFLIKRL